MTSRSPGSSSATRILTASASHGWWAGAVPPGGPAQRRGAIPDRGQPEREHRADRARPTGMLEEPVGDGAALDDRVAPVVELDQLGEQLGAHPEAIARDPVDDELRSDARRRGAHRHVTLPGRPI